MIGLLLVTHAPLGHALLACAAHVYGREPQNCVVLDVAPASDPAEMLVRARQMLEPLDSGRGVLVLTDLFGATPANVAAQLSRPGQIEVLTGLNLPMLLRTLTYRETVALDVLIDKAMTGATAGVMKIASTAPQNQRSVLLSPPDTPPEAGHANARLHHQQ